MKTATVPILTQVSELLQESGIPLFGTGPAHLLAGEPEGYRPMDLLPSAKSLLCAGLPVPRGVLCGGNRAMETTWRTHNLYYRKMDELMLQLCLLLEEGGDEAVPVFGCYPMELHEGGAIWGFLSLVRMAAAVEIGGLGRNGLLLHSRYGPTLILGGLVTSADLPHQAWPEAEAFACPEGCTACREACPVAAIGPTGRVDMIRCLRHSSKTPQFAYFLKARDWRPEDRDALFLTSTVDEHNLNTCSLCVTACPAMRGANYVKSAIKEIGCL